MVLESGIFRSLRDGGVFMMLIVGKMGMVIGFEVFLLMTSGRGTRRLDCFGLIFSGIEDLTLLLLER